MEKLQTLLFMVKSISDSYSNLEPRLSIRYQLDDTRSIKASYQKINQYLHLITNASSPTPLDIWATFRSFY